MIREMPRYGSARNIVSSKFRTFKISTSPVHIEARHTLDSFCVLPTAPSGSTLKQSSASPHPSKISVRQRNNHNSYSQKRTQIQCTYSVSSSHKKVNTRLHLVTLVKKEVKHTNGRTVSERPCLTDSYLYPNDAMRGSEEPWRKLQETAELNQFLKSGRNSWAVS